MKKQILKTILAGAVACLTLTACSTTQEQPQQNSMMTLKVKPLNDLSQTFTVKLENGGMLSTDGSYIYQENGSMKSLYKIRSSEYSNVSRKLMAKEVAGLKTLDLNVLDQEMDQGWKTVLDINGEKINGTALNEMKTVDYKQLEREAFLTHKFEEDEPTLTDEAKQEVKAVKEEVVKTKQKALKKLETRSNKISKELKATENNKTVVDSMKDKVVEVKDKATEVKNTIVETVKEKTNSVVEAVEEIKK